MTEELRAFLDRQADELERKVQEAIELCDGSMLSAIYSLVIANTFLSEENTQLRDEVAVLKKQASFGYGRNRSSQC